MAQLVIPEYWMQGGMPTYGLKVLTSLQKIPGVAAPLNW
jgi:hypothetical protein